MQVVGHSPHGDGQLADLLQLDGPLVSTHDQWVHPPVRGLREQVNERLEEAHTQILQVLRWFHSLRVSEEHVPLQGKVANTALQTFMGIF